MLGLRIAFTVAVMAIVPMPVLATYRDVGTAARAAKAGLAPEQYLAAAMAMDAAAVV